MFYDPATGKPYGDIKRGFHSAMRKAGIKDFVFHDLRHTFASHLIMAGVDITTVSKLLGHRSLTMTLRYSHLAPAHLAEAVNKLKNYYNSTTIAIDSKETKICKYLFLKDRAVSSAGRAPRSQRGSRGFESPTVHHPLSLEINRLMSFHFT